MVVSLRTAHRHEDGLAAEAIEERRLAQLAVEVAHVQAVQADGDEVHGRSRMLAQNARRDTPCGRAYDAARRITPDREAGLQR
jgi:hypothetical protein